VAVGFNTLFSNIDGNRNTGMGYRTLAFNASGNDNTAIGWNALFNNRGTAGDNTATGSQALLHNNDGVDNTAVGSQAMQFNVSAFTNVAVGAFAAQRNDSSGSGTAIFNTAVGGFALQANVDGARNTAVGTGAMEVANGGNDNTAVGEIAGIGITTHSHIIAIGSGVTGVSSTFGEVDNSAYIGSAFGQPVAPATGISLAIDADGKLGTFLSSRRFKKVIKPMGQSSEAVLALKPVTFQYNYDKKGTPQFGLIGEEVAEVNPNLVVRDKNGEVLTVRYEAVNAMLLNEFLKEHRKNEEQQSKIFQQDATIAHQQKQIDALTAGLQKVSAQLETSKPVPQMVNNP
jgi:hypothetical protein